MFMRIKSIQDLVVVAVSASGGDLIGAATGYAVGGSGVVAFEIVFMVFIISGRFCW